MSFGINGTALVDNHGFCGPDLLIPLKLICHIFIFPFHFNLLKPVPALYREASL